MRSKNGGVWVYSARDGWRVFWRDEANGTLRGSRIFPSREEADRMAAEIRAQMACAERTVEEAIEAFRTSNAARGLVAESVRQIDTSLRTLCAPLLARPLRTLTPALCARTYQEHAESGRFAPATHGKALERAKTWGNWLCELGRGWLRTNPWKDVKKIGKRGDHRGTDSLTVDEARKWLDAAFAAADSTDEARAVGATMAILTLLHGLNPGELVQVQRRDLEDDDRQLAIHHRVKTGNRRRVVTVHEWVRPLLAKLAEGKASHHLLFGAHDRDFVTDQIKRLCADAGVRAVTARGMRHSHADLQAEAGVSLDLVALTVGHGKDASGATLRQHYLRPGALASGAGVRVAARLGVLDGGKAGARK